MRSMNRSHYQPRIKLTDASKLQDEYAKLVAGLQDADDDEDPVLANPGNALFHRVVRHAEPE
jgi:hypothetical protein